MTRVQKFCRSSTIGFARMQLSIKGEGRMSVHNAGSHNARNWTAKRCYHSYNTSLRNGSRLLGNDGKTAQAASFTLLKATARISFHHFIPPLSFLSDNGKNRERLCVYFAVCILDPKAAAAKKNKQGHCPSPFPFPWPYKKMDSLCAGNPAQFPVNCSTKRSVPFPNPNPIPTQPF